MVSFFGIIAFVAASYGLYAQIHKKEIAQAVAAYIVTVLTIIIAVVSFRNSPNTTLVEQEDIAKESAKPTSTSTIQPVDSEDDGESEKKLNTKETMSFTGNKISGIMDGEDSREEQYMATQTGIYRFDFDIDDVNKGYCFYILDSKQEEVQRGYSSDSGINAYMVLCQDLVQVKMSFSHSNLPAIPKLPVDTILQNHRVTYNRNDYEFVWYYKTFPSIQIPGGMHVCNC